MFYQNRGMFLETIINYTIEIINQEQRALIFKDHYQLRNQHHSSIKARGNVDYHGVYHGKYFCFETKSTAKSFLPWNNFKNHQLEWLDATIKQGGISFVIIYFIQDDTYFLIFWWKLKLLKASKTNISYQFLQKNGHILEILYPFYLNFLSFLE